jgi:hypothetical protein
MKHLIISVALAVLAAPVLAQPYEQTELDRELPKIAFPPVSVVGGSPDRMPFEQTQLDRGLTAEEPVLYAAAGGGTMSDRDIAATERSSHSAWADDHNFVAPPQ